MALSAYQDLDEYFTKLENHWGGYDAYRARFLRHYTPENRATDLAAFDKLLEKETRVTREHAAWVMRRRELGDLHSLLLRSGK